VNAISKEATPMRANLASSLVARAAAREMLEMTAAYSLHTRWVISRSKSEDPARSGMSVDCMRWRKLPIVFTDTLACIARCRSQWVRLQRSRAICAICAVRSVVRALRYVSQ